MGNASQSLFYLMFSSQGVALTHAKSTYLRRKVTSTAIRPYPKYAHEFFLKGMNEKMTKKPKLISSIRAKLVSAVAMLLVAMIMVVSSTYAWFTLSTAPEVTGISTQIGANGALEMALNTGLADGPKNGQVDPADDSNIYWGNLVNLDKTEYGLSNITLLPSKLTVITDEQNGGPDTFATTGFLQTPKYGADGRVSELVAEAITGKYNGTAFFDAADAFGVRGIGTASGMTDRELAYRNAASDASTLMGKATAGASNSLNTNGAVLANIAVKHGTSDGNETYTQDDINAMIAICDDLLGTSTKDGVLENIEKAYLQYILQYAAGAKGGAEDTVWQAVKSAVEADNATISNVTTFLGDVTLPEELTEIFAKLEATKTTVSNAKNTLSALNKDSYVWGDFSGALGSLCNTSAITVNGWTVPDIKDNPDGFAKEAMNGLTVTMATNGGVYADVADHCGNYKASIALDISYGGVSFEDFPATMNTDTSVNPVYLNQVGAAVKAEGPFVGTSDAPKPLTEFYGYIIDLSFRTNAANSNLLLQTAATDRIYDDKTVNNDTEDINNTWGHGSTMTFSSSSTSFTTNMMKSLMENIKIVFFTPGETNTILAYAELDAQNATASTDGNGLTANIYLLDDAGQKITTQEDADILALTQNVTHNVSVLVYLDGENLENADVAADAANSMTGKMNLQFSSSATLDPMEYADLHPKASTGGGEQTP